jgi:hypothetical protein
MALQNSWILIGRRAVRKMRIRTVVRIFPYPDWFPVCQFDMLGFETFLHVYKVVMWRKSILGSFLRIRSLGNINKYLYQHKFHRKSQENKPFELLLATVSFGGKMFWFVYLFQKINKDEFNVFNTIF